MSESPNIITANEATHANLMMSFRLETMLLAVLDMQKQILLKQGETPEKIEALVSIALERHSGLNEIERINSFTRIVKAAIQEQQ